MSLDPERYQATPSPRVEAGIEMESWALGVDG